jgi:hypothetical protein
VGGSAFESTPTGIRPGPCRTNQHGTGRAVGGYVVAESGSAGSRKGLVCLVMTVEVLSNEELLLLGRPRRSHLPRVLAVRGVNDQAASKPLLSPDDIIDSLFGRSG